MKTPSLLLLSAVFLAGSFLSLRAEDWKTNDGKVYQDVKVVRSEPDAVTILHHDGGGRIPLANLPPDLQKRFHYDPAKAKAAADARARDDAENGKALQAEMNEASDMHQPGAEPTEDSETTSSTSHNGDVAHDAPVSQDPNHHSMFELSSSMHSLKLDLSDATHHSIDDLSNSAAAMRPDLSDPDYHTMAHLTCTIKSLAADPDPNHHSMDELSNLGL